MLWNVITVLLVVLALVVLAVGFPGMLGRRTKYGIIRLPPPRRPEERGAAPPESGGDASPGTRD